MKITIGESKKKKNLKRLTKEALEVHRVPDDLDNDCDGAYGDGYEAGREYASEEQELDEEFATEDDYNVDPDATIPTLEEAGYKLQQVRAQGATSAPGVATSGENTSLARKINKSTRPKFGPKGLPVGGKSPPGQPNWGEFPRYYDHGKTGHRPGSEKWREMMKKAPVEKPPEPKVKARPKKLSLKLPTNPLAGKGTPFDASWATETAGTYDAKKLRSLSFKLRSMGTSALRSVARRFPLLIAYTIIGDVGFRGGVKAKRHYSGLDNMARRGGPKTPQEQSALEGILIDWANDVDLGYGDETFFKSSVERVSQPYAGAGEEEVRQAREYGNLKKRNPQKFTTTRLVPKKEIKEMKIKIGKKKVLTEDDSALKRDRERARHARIRKSDWEGIKEFATLFKEDPWKAWSQFITGQRNDPFLGPRAGMSSRARKKLPSMAKIPSGYSWHPTDFGFNAEKWSDSDPAVNIESPEHKEAMEDAYRRWYPKMSKKIDDAYKWYAEMAQKVDSEPDLEGQSMAREPDLEGQSMVRESVKGGDTTMKIKVGKKEVLEEEMIAEATDPKKMSIIQRYFYKKLINQKVPPPQAAKEAADQVKKLTNDQLDAVLTGIAKRQRHQKVKPKKKKGATTNRVLQAYAQMADMLRKRGYEISNDPESRRVAINKLWKKLGVKATSFGQMMRLLKKRYKGPETFQNYFHSEAPKQVSDPGMPVGTGGAVAKDNTSVREGTGAPSTQRLREGIRKEVLTEAKMESFKKEMAPQIKKVQQQGQTKGKKWYDLTIKQLYKKWVDQNAFPEQLVPPGQQTWAGADTKSPEFLQKMRDAQLRRQKRQKALIQKQNQGQSAHSEDWAGRHAGKDMSGQSIERSRPGGTPVTSSVPSIAQMAKDKMAREEGGYSDDEMRKRRAMGGQTPEITQGRSRKTRPFGMKESQNFHDKWKTFLKEDDSGEGTPASRLGDDLLKNLDQLEASTIDPEGGMPWIGADEVGEFIVDQGGEEQALAYIESMRQEIIDLMAEEYEELKFTEDHPEYDTSKMGEEEVEVEEDL